jgi:Protein of unknown function (DUF2637)
VSTPTTEKDKTLRGALFLVMGAALTVGTWSVYTLLRDRFHAPTLVAVLGSILFDSAALFFASLAQKYATSPDSGLIPRLAMLAMICTSSWVNWQHALIEHWGKVGCIVLAGAPIVSEAAFELHHRYVHKEALRAQGRVPSALPVVGKWAWLLHPGKAYRVIDQAVVTRLDAVADDAQRITPEIEAHRITAASLDAADAAHHVTLPDYVLRALAAASPHHPQLPAAPAADDAPAEAADQTSDAPVERREAQAAPTPAAPRITAVVKRSEDPRITDIASLSKAAAVRAIHDAHPTASAPEIAHHLATHGITADAAYIRTVLSRTAKKIDRKMPGGYL